MQHESKTTTDYAYFGATTQPHEYATTEDKDHAVDALLQLSESKNDIPSNNIPGDNSELLLIGSTVPDVAPTKIALTTEELTAAIKNIALTGNGKQNLNKHCNTNDMTMTM